MFCVVVTITHYFLLNTDNIFINENAFESIVCEMTTIWFGLNELMIKSLVTQYICLHVGLDATACVILCWFLVACTYFIYTWPYFLQTFQDNRTYSNHYSN